MNAVFSFGGGKFGSAHVVGEGYFLRRDAGCQEPATVSHVSLVTVSAIAECLCVASQCAAQA